jgi:integrase
MSRGRLQAALTQYLAVRRSLGFTLARDGLLLEQFAGFCEQAGVSRVTNEVALAWVSAPAKASPGWLAMRLTIVRGFATWLQASDPATEVPPLGWLPPRRRATPYLYSADEVAALLAAARRVRWPLSAATYETLIALLAVTGMRIGEAIRLDRSDLSPGEGLLTISDSKSGTSRQLLLHPSTVSALGCYLRRRRHLSPAPGEPALFVHPAGNRLHYPATQQMFRVLLRRAGIGPRSQRCRPTIHGLRH